MENGAANPPSSMAPMSARGHASEGPIGGNNNLDEEKDGHGKGRKLDQGAAFQGLKRSWQSKSDHCRSEERLRNGKKNP